MSTVAWSLTINKAVESFCSHSMKMNEAISIKEKHTRMALSKGLFQEVWGETCYICCNSDEDFFLRNECGCRELVCRSCYYRLTKCPYCRRLYENHDLVVSGNLLSDSLARRARRNWNHWFDAFHGKEIFKIYYRHPLFNNDPVHLWLRTGSFFYLNEAGICVNRQDAYEYVRNQLWTFLEERGHVWINWDTLCIARYYIFSQWIEILNYLKKT